MSSKFDELSSTELQAILFEAEDLKQDLDSINNRIREMTDELIPVLNKEDIPESLLLSVITGACKNRLQ